MADGRILFEREREDMAKIVQLIFERKNTNVAGGNFSFKTTDKTGKEYIIMTPTMMSQAYLGHLSASQILVVEPHTRKVIAGEGGLTREINMHEAVYDANPDIKAVLHAHAPNSMFWATSGLDMPNLTEATQKVEYIEVLEFEPNCSEELAEIVSNHIKTMPRKQLPHEFLLDSHGVLITTGGDTGIEAIHSALAVLDTVEWNAEIAYKQTIFQKLGILDGYYSKGVKIGTIDDLINGEPIYNTIIKATAGGD
ncbi:class II aldolase/adducin family protein [Enterococcus sp. DIV0242_7C1]|uniref:Class II aldolase and adducin protein n=1 Tax=Candidatus Enterococcus dunnyi TaxID=1834192 RepID=A0A200J049_9ENTE|nr:MULTISPECIES: class II aldolase/adducin family protein [unclassified Enterococcus]MBO0470437.1 class II aldolase/adducin family protein [Enterococcus sp. DIV0242_7C1]MCA5014336.1 class II aldolase/adducin family protein [Enterococcus sp. S23]MCA5017747.1 class II aldolase/adducin family protein [Enterococcus sp. S22(2020)]OUZ30199.1 class II aldolase and adducin protein [Enterococcus sp. 9D6_DIV0238]